MQLKTNAASPIGKRLIFFGSVVTVRVRLRLQEINVCVICLHNVLKSNCGLLGSKDILGK